MGNLLNSIHSPADIKHFSVPQLEALAQEIRDRLIQSVARTGGHIGPNLGVVELTIAMHYVFDTPQDRFVFDVSHQAYVHKLLTGRANRFDTLRQPGGLNGFMLRSESQHDSYGAGHAGTALSAALGMAVARDIAGGHEHVVALAGDAAFTNGISFEALNNIADQTRRLIVVLNDNEWSIDRNVGAIARYLHKIVTNEHVSQFHDSAARLLKRIGGPAAANMVRRAEEAAKGMLWPSVLFEEFGLTYYGPIDGHNLSLLIDTFKFLKQQDRPVLLHAITQKGRGFEPALAGQKKFHGLGPFDPETGETSSSGQPTYSEVFARSLVKLADQNDKVVAITAAMPNGTGLDHFRPHHPARYFDVGIAEEHAVIFAAGMATRGFKPYCAIYSTFLQRAFDPIVHDVCLQNLPVVFCMDRGGLSGDDGPTHHGLFDISYLRGIPNIVHMVPADEDELADMMYTAMLHDGPSAIRYPRGTGPGHAVKQQPEALPIGKAKVLHEGEDIAILGLGALLPMAEQIREELARQGYRAAVINPRFVKPVDTELLAHYADRVTAFLTLEDHVLMGGFGSAVMEELNALGKSTPVVRIGWPDRFIEHGKVDQLRARYGISVEAAMEKLAPYLTRSAPLSVR
ncbi:MULTISPECIES: 1-deoxy-D-xylulose-5-phosphate synthase [Acidobacterium]|uniref:1-deoxy-D-xylulose-5-phosphate synthase n=1 Tax=Acidobacterium capsulatum (strain ATCC 51196 / DSM 11244 / BCRC 80197 / JCM 7670 / NBRC 15755 / NCIMB 13165 / 161) TaxID=240015 RepID=DXS_ACIC5|nr:MULTISPECIES: 1-deoxy-D-xylulose-5-phosphate synthase [Acidobacterium]C1F3C4.1 RecName: Full=1-deoxy-D-xylulose-5-phosphate synthase; AltName: Full=1-deoxyxylulose-5-phosphate synthase; Short=DXP synthase; Short=DXPS [Acidobacterium capsulatum ATCC 51196]ACO33552.1 1-deoxy-D-xylulose-5-phosphate synthase [Acidobacterium capsulatum ATCC 51196]HCT60592.1 1-deoxy-D-xylulose-5-phosphate synthase [Acidobacterium sp.]